MGYMTKAMDDVKKQKAYSRCAGRSEHPYEKLRSNYCIQVSLLREGPSDVFCLPGGFQSSAAQRPTNVQQDGKRVSRKKAL